MQELQEYIPVEYQTIIEIVAILLLTGIAGTITAKLFKLGIRKAEAEGSSDLTSLKFLKRGVTFLIYLVGISFAVYMVPQFRFIAKSILASAGLLAIAVGFAAQQALGNIVSGIFIVIFKPYKIGDRILLRTDLTGVIEDVNLRHTVIRNFENKRIIIPNSVISNEILINSNYNDDKIIKWVEIGISYDSDIKLARKIMQEEILSHPSFIDARSEEQIEKGDEIVPVRLISLGDSSVNLRALATAIDPPSAFVMGCDLLESIKDRFDAEGIEIPFPHRTIVYKNEASKNQESASPNS
tara:strand:- start:3602 stop:4492 length:891 start_codon:yes stop_codon:yes gene_type:complete